MTTWDIPARIQLIPEAAKFNTGQSMSAHIYSVGKIKIKPS